MSSRRLLSDVYKTHILLLLLALFLGNCYAQTSPNCVPSCGNIHISHPFRVKGDPKECGNKKYELECDHNRPVLYLNSSAKYYVHAINYNNYTIRLVDVGLKQGSCSSLPLHSLSDLNFTNADQYALKFPYGAVSYSSAAFNFYIDHLIPWDVAVALWVDCEKPVKSRFYSESNTSASSCIDKATSSSSLSSGEKRRYSYFLFGSLLLSDVADQCKIDEIRITTLWLPADKSQANISYSDFHSKLEYGFEVSWLSSACEQCEGLGNHFCYMGSNYSVNCYKFCDYGPAKNRTFQCRLEIFYNEYFIPGYKVRGFDVTGWIILGRTSCGMLCLWAFLIYKFRRRHLSMFDTVEDFLQGQNNLMPIRYSYSEIKKMSRDFKDKLGEGGYGSVYKGKLRSGYVAAIKILGKPKSNGQEFINEVATIGRIHHVNVVRLIGFCATRSKRALVYEYMPNGSLEKYLFSQEGNISLSCKQMYDISVGVARGIEYLHQGCDMQILHFDIKPHNILLDENFNPKVSDFGLAKLYSTDNSMVSFTAARGTVGYMAPELFYKNIGRVSYKADVYSYGMLLMEMAGRRRNLNAFADQTSQIYFPSWIYDQFKAGKEIEMGEATEEEREMVRKMVITALWCIQMRPSDRPSMNKVLEMLEGNVEALEMPPKPFLTPQEMPIEDQ
ncbi:LEAF RUST 10 DISEASE-RESISTANCE LOCUS RECEPTOR-LIKE PROTEIN KINASE-like 2.5 [Rhododendron vialii]|uniref:LEAF RUST 10 DISEASE-RESISTANCE LOCUS RECEPTOR-LIKE PROTEIN KINASE-like 2.5 n=1 Tax=Rhododendron vialii TaxID=182163 RepID=UPI00265D6380|nr:LEAF RUST 10 DISEASE-RESISTANCE LOCUS RECEPTOR-LIKE PROTEIN KINASE-like 2.5 [Rhododendron vialii]